MTLISTKPRFNQSNLGTFLVNGKTVRSWSKNGRVFFRVYRARKVVSMSLMDLYTAAQGQLSLPL